MKRKILIGILALILIAGFSVGLVQGQPTPATTTPAYLPDIVDDPDHDGEELWYQQFNGKENMIGFYSNYTNMFHWFGDMGINVVTHIATTHHVIGYAYSPDGVNWAIDRHWGQGADLLDFAMSEDGTTGDPGIYDVVLEANGRYFWIVGLNTYHAAPLEIYARKGELHLNGSITWVAPVQTIIALDIGIAEVTWPIDAEVDSNGRLFVSFNTLSGGPIYTGYVRWTELTNGTWVTSDTISYDSLLSWNKADIDREYLKLNRLAEGKMAWTGLFRDATPKWWAETVCFDGTAWLVGHEHTLFLSISAEGNRHRTWDIVSYGDRLIGTYVSRSVGFQRLFVKEAVYHGDWLNSTELISDLPELTGVNVAHLEVDHDGDAIIFFYVHGEDIVNYTYRYSNYTWQTDWTVLLNDSSASYWWNRFGFMDTTENYYPFWFQDNTEAFTELGFHYLVWGEEEALPLLFEHLNTTLYNSDGSVNDGWLFEGEVYDLESYIVLGELFNVNTSDSRHDISFHWNNETEQMWINVEPGDQFTLGLAYAEFERFGNITRLLWRFIPDRSIIDSLDNSWGRTLTDGVFSTYDLLGFNASIYNLGGTTFYTLTGDGGRTPGGQPFEIFATNGSDGSSARAEQIYRKLQGIHFLIEIDMDNPWDGGNGEFDIVPGVGFVDIGIDYRLNATWVEGFYVRLYVQDADVGHHNAGNDHDWIEWQVDWYNYNPGTGNVQNFRSGTIFSNYWGYENENLTPDFHNRTSGQIWVDLWFDRTNASETIAGQVNAMFHGMREHGSSWWFGYGAFQPMTSEYGNALMLDDLYDEGGNVTDSLKFDLMRVFVEVGKVAAPQGGDDETWTIRAVENFNRKQADDRMQGIEQPSFEQTLVLDMPMFQSLNPLVRAVDGISRSIWMGALGFIKILWGAMDTIFEWAGFGAGFFSILSRFVIETIPDLIIVIMQNLSVLVISFVDIIESIFNLLVIVVPTYVIGLGWLAESLIDYWRAFNDIFAGGIVDFSIIEDLALGSWVSFGITMLPFYEIWTIIWSKDVPGKMKERFAFYSALFGGLLSFFRGMVSMVGELVQAIRSFLPI